MGQLRSIHSHLMCPRCTLEISPKWEGRLVVFVGKCCVSHVMREPVVALTVLGPGGLGARPPSATSTLFNHSVCGYHSLGLSFLIYDKKGLK